MKQTFILVFCILLSFSPDFLSQDLETPRPSPNATVTQTVGVTHISIDYSSPGVKGRVIWGELVPYNEIWRTGANEVTSITFDDPVMINGNNLDAGTYGIHTLPGEIEWDVIFSGDTEVDAGSQFDKNKEVFRIKVKPEETPFTERMTFIFSNTTDDKTTVNLIWEKLKISFDVEVNTGELTLTKAREKLSWVPSFQAANYCLQYNVNLEEGLRWIDASLLFKEVYWNTRIKAQLLEKLGNKNDAITTMEKAIELGAQMESEPFDYGRMKELLSGWKSQ